MKFKNDFWMKSLVILGILVIMLLTAFMNWEAMQHKFMTADMWPLSKSCKRIEKSATNTTVSPKNE